MSEKRLWRATGGLFWHLRALARIHGAWAPFREEIDRWLTSWPPRTRDIILVGPSAGWCLPTSFLLRFERVVAVDPDPLARILFYLRHGSALADAGIATIWMRADFFADDTRLLADHPEAAVLFCNVLGQMGFTGEEPAAVEARHRLLAQALRDRPWASFHDLLSGRGAPTRRLRDLEGRLSSEALLRSFGLDGEWRDHLTSDVFLPSTPRRVIAWRFGGDGVHLVEAAFVEPVICPPS